jgi:imidazolonepropionase-like amidohydrolase
MIKNLSKIVLFVCISLTTFAQKSYLLKPDRVFDGTEIREGLMVLITGDKIVSVDRNIVPPANTEVIELSNCTILPGLIEGHSH